MTINSKRKGKCGELEAAHAIEQHLGIPARRGQQFSGGADSPDVVIELPGVHVEVKHTERFNAYTAVAQARRDGCGQVPLVLHRRNRGEWLAVVPLSELMRLAELLYLSKAEVT